MAATEPSGLKGHGPGGRRLGLIGCGRIVMPVLQAWGDGELPGWTVTGVLARRSREVDMLRATSDADTFFAAGHDLILEGAGPAALAAHGARALAVADVWTVSAAAFADPALLAALEAVGSRTGHRLRLVSGAIAGLDGVAMACVDPGAVLQLDVDLPPGDGAPGLVFSGTVREAARKFPDGVNVAAAAALAGPGLDAARINVGRAGQAAQPRLALVVTSRYGKVQAATEPWTGPGIHPVAACLIACLRRELQTVWVG